MKSFLLISLLALAPLAARADGKRIACNEVGTGSPDAGYEVDVDIDRQHADLSTESLAGPHKVAELDCEHLKETPGKPWLRCTVDDKRGSVEFELSESGRPIEEHAKLVVINKNGEKHRADMNCGDETSL